MYSYAQDRTQHQPTIRDLVPANDYSHGRTFTIISFTAEMWQTGMMQEPVVHSQQKKILA